MGMQYRVVGRDARKQLVLSVAESLIGWKRPRRLAVAIPPAYASQLTFELHGFAVSFRS
jgi:hypothetical protein